MDTAAIENLLIAPHEVMLEGFNHCVQRKLSKTIAAAVLTVDPREAQKQ